jgi:hypothetical protein
MDGSRFDAIVRAAGAARSRRGVLKTLTGAIAAGLFGHAGLHPHPTRAQETVRCLSVADCQATVEAVWTDCKDRCGEMGDMSKGLCILFCNNDHATQQANCRLGGCIDGVCMNGICCRAGQANCKGQCIDAACPPGSGQVYNPATCACGCPPNTYLCPSSPVICFSIQCPGSQQVNLETCECYCPPNKTACECGYVDITKDPANCGACGHACANGRTCVNGGCLCSSDSCPGGQARDPDTCECGCGGASCAGACCGGKCVNLQRDAANCGACGKLCGFGGRCEAGVCKCGPFAKDHCNGVCTDFRYDPGACGGCGAAYVCGSGLPNCCPGKAIKTGICTNRMFDGDNCGQCGLACAGGKTCQSGKCRCPQGTTECKGKCVAETAGATCEGCAQHELACGGACCTTGLVCSSTSVAMTPSGLRTLQSADASCVCPDGRDLCGDVCCPADQTCADDACAPRTCQLCQIEQDGQCYDVVCDPGQICVNDVCVAGNGDNGGGPDIKLACPPDWLDCSSYCCPPGNYYCGAGCCFDPNVPCFPEVPKAWPTAGG